MRVALFLLLAALVASGCAQRDPPPAGTEPATCDGPAFAPADPAWVPERPRVRLDTTRGAIVVELDVERAPVTAGNFLNLTRSGFFDGTLFHRVVQGFVIQGGDPLSKDADPSNDGTGGPTDAAGKETAIPDEFHPQLRHDAAGVLSMANSGPNTGGSQFFLTLAAVPHLDDRHSVFGRVVEGMDVVRAIGETQVDADEHPVERIAVTKAEVVESTRFEPTRSASVHVVVGEKRAEAGRPVRFAVVLGNGGTLRDALGVHVEAPAGWTCRTDHPVVVPAGTARVVFLSLTPPEGASGTTLVPVGVRSVRGAEAATSLQVTIAELGRLVTQGTKVVANYAGLLPDGRLFDTSMAAVGQDASQPKFETIGGWRARGSFDTFAFTVGSGVIPGFTVLAKTARVGETVTGLIPAADAYATGNPYERPLTGRDLIFELEIVRLG